MTPANRARMREVIGRAVRTGLFPGGVGPHAHGHDPGHAHDAAVGGNDAGVDTLPPAAIQGTASVAPPATGLPRRERFRAALEALAGIVHEASSIDQAADVVAGIAARLGTSSILSWTDEAMALPGMTAALQARGLAAVADDLPQAGDARASRLAELAALSLGLTGADAGLAETGSIVIASGPGRPRMASLLVPVHVAVLRVDRLVDSISGLLATRGDLVAAGSNLVAITGPSRTADIEHTLSRGVHGPGEVHVILLES
jgi:L-lactate dehydrogenase complex protein LldG